MTKLQSKVTELKSLQLQQLRLAVCSLQSYVIHKIHKGKYGPFNLSCASLTLRGPNKPSNQLPADTFLNEGKRSLRIKFVQFSAAATTTQLLYVAVYGLLLMTLFPITSQINDWISARSFSTTPKRNIQ